MQRKGKEEETHARFRSGWNYVHRTGRPTLTGTKEGDLKVQFAEVMSQMTTQVGGGYNYGGQNSRQDVAAVTGNSSVADDYERYQNAAGSIKIIQQAKRTFNQKMRMKS